MLKKLMNSQMVQSEQQLLKNQILDLVRKYSLTYHSSFRPGDDPLRQQWCKGDPIPYAGRVFTENEVEAAVSSTLDFWLTLGSEGNAFQQELANFLGIKKSLLVNSGSSANLVALSTITSPKIPKPKRLCRGDEVITVAAGFPTTVAPIFQVGAKPVFIDVDHITGNVDCNQLEDAYESSKTKAVMLAHALGNPFNILEVLKFCKRNNLWLIEDNCDALGCTYSMPKEIANELGFYDNSPGLDDGPEYITRWTGTWGDISTQSFYPPHHLTMGEGGSVNIISSNLLSKIAESFRDWGRDCWCPSGIDNTCNKRFEWQLGELPLGYDHKYTYSHLGYNLKPLDIQAAIGRVQLKRLNEFIKIRKDNWLFLRTNLDSLSDYIDFSLPTHATNWSINNGFEWDSSGCRTDCSWFGFKISIKSSCLLSRTELARELDINKIGNRMLFGGNLVRQPAFVDLIMDDPDSFRVVGDLTNADKIMNDTLFLGTFPGLTCRMLKEEVCIIRNFFENTNPI